jgi:ParB family chromosome partitioning protein
MSQPEVKVIPITAIRENPVALRSVDTECEEYVGLRDSVAKVGILDPISVRRRTEDVDGTVVEYYEIVNGLHRYTAATEVGLTVVPVNVVTLNDSETLEAQVMANIHRIETKAVEYTKQLQRIFSANPTLTLADMASRLAKSPSWVQQRLSLLKLEKSIQALVDDNKITVANAVALSKLPPAEQLNYVDQAIQMKTDEFAPTVQSRAKELKDAAREGRSAVKAEFVPVASPRRFGELKEEFSSASVGPELCRQVGAKTAEEGFALAIAYVIHLDPLSVAAQTAADAEKKQKVEDAKKRRLAERAKAKADAAAEAAAKAAEGLDD